MKMKDSTIETLNKTRNDLVETLEFVKNRPWNSTMKILENDYIENTKFAISTCEDLIRNVDAQIKKKTKQQKK